MFAGHIGAGLALARMDRQLNPGWLVAASLWPDLLLWALVLLGVEQIVLPTTPGTQPGFHFPWSHSLAATLAWSAAAGAIALLRRATRRAATLLAAAVASHWVVDAVVHRAELPLGGPGSPQVGLGLWERLPLGLCLEAVLTLGGLLLFLAGAKVGRGRSWGIAALTLALLVFTILGMTLAPTPPSSLVTQVLVIAAYLWLGRAREA